MTFLRYSTRKMQYKEVPCPLALKPLIAWLEGEDAVCHYHRYHFFVKPFHLLERRQQLFIYLLRWDGIVLMESIQTTLHQIHPLFSTASPLPWEGEGGSLVVPWMPQEASLGMELVSLPRQSSWSLLYPNNIIGTPAVDTNSIGNFLEFWRGDV